ncbi:hypothetical protein MTR67_034586 [Solanum verrucosum]|uniref:RNase H type-1 domain-containing protein n=1 Tax=Solanum verrucosum TaxID=315347 RepID=A0AAF0U8Q7_SOLVR|nr:hypothetical protein MTR67_034586 [Solanum verrucosum]
MTRVIYLVLKDINNLLLINSPYIKWPSKWPELIQFAGNCSHDIKITKVSWFKPPTNVVKINSDGSALDNPGKIGAGGIVRDAQGDLIYAYATPLGHGTNNQADIEAAQWGLSWCLNNGFNQVIFEEDSVLVVHWIKQEVAPPWNLQHTVANLKRTCDQFQSFSCNHTFRETNFMADVLSKTSHNSEVPQHYFHVHQLPKKLEDTICWTREKCQILEEER